MAKRELSSTLKNLKFMQRASLREEKTKKEEHVTPDGNFPSSSTPRKCVVIMEGDPHPGAIKGRMSFQSFNTKIDKLNEEAANPNQQEGSTTCSGNQSEGMANSRENGSAGDESESLRLDSDSSDAIGDLKRKKPDVVAETEYPNKSPKNVHGDQDSSSSKSSSHKQRKQEKLDWNVLRPPKSQRKRG